MRFCSLCIGLYSTVVIFTHLHTTPVYSKHVNTCGAPKGTKQSHLGSRAATARIPTSKPMKPRQDIPTLFTSGSTLKVSVVAPQQNQTQPNACLSSHGQSHINFLFKDCSTAISTWSGLRHKRSLPQQLRTRLSLFLYLVVLVSCFELQGI